MEFKSTDNGIVRVETVEVETPVSSESLKNLADRKTEKAEKLMEQAKQLLADAKKVAKMES